VGCNTPQYRKQSQSTTRACLFTAHGGEMNGTDALEWEPGPRSVLSSQFAGARIRKGVSR